MGRQSAAASSAASLRRFAAILEAKTCPQAQGTHEAACAGAGSSLARHLSIAVAETNYDRRGSEVGGGIGDQSRTSAMRACISSPAGWANVSRIVK